MEKSISTLESMTQPSKSVKPLVLRALEPLTRMEIDALRQKKKLISEHYQKVLASKV